MRSLRQFAGTTFGSEPALHPGFARDRLTPPRSPATHRSRPSLRTRPPSSARDAPRSSARGPAIPHPSRPRTLPLLPDKVRRIPTLPGIPPPSTRLQRDRPRLIAQLACLLDPRREPRQHLPSTPQRRLVFPTCVPTRVPVRIPIPDRLQEPLTPHKKRPVMRGTNHRPSRPRTTTHELVIHVAIIARPSLPRNDPRPPTSQNETRKHTPNTSKRDTETRRTPRPSPTSHQPKLTPTNQHTKTQANKTHSRCGVNAWNSDRT